MDARNSATDFQTNITIIMRPAVLSADCVCVRVRVGMRKIHSTQQQNRAAADCDVGLHAPAWQH